MSARIRIVLEDGDRPAVWVTVCPIEKSYPSALGAERAAGIAAAGFIASLARQEEALEKWLAGDDLR